MFSFWRVIFKNETWKFEVDRKFGKSHERKIVIEFQEKSVKILWKLYFNMAAIPTVSSFAWKIQGKSMLKVVWILVLFWLWFQEKMEAMKVLKYSYTSQTIQDQFYGSGLVILQLNCQIYLWHWNLVAEVLIYKTKWIQQLVIFGVVYEIIEALFLLFIFSDEPYRIWWSHFKIEISCPSIKQTSWRPSSVFELLGFTHDTCGRRSTVHAGFRNQIVPTLEIKS